MAHKLRKRESFFNRIFILCSQFVETLILSDGRLPGRMIESIRSNLPYLKNKYWINSEYIVVSFKIFFTTDLCRWALPTRVVLRPTEFLRLRSKDSQPRLRILAVKWRCFYFLCVSSWRRWADDQRCHLCFHWLMQNVNTGGPKNDWLKNWDEHLFDSQYYQVWLLVIPCTKKSATKAGSTLQWPILVKNTISRTVGLSWTATVWITIHC